MSDAIEVVSIKQTCLASPSQWQGKTKHGKMVYARYRFGTLTVSVSHSKTDNLSEAVTGLKIYNKDLGSEYDGYLSYLDLIAQTHHLFHWPIPELGE